MCAVSAGEVKGLAHGRPSPSASQALSTPTTCSRLSEATLRWFAVDLASGRTDDKAERSRGSTRIGCAPPGQTGQLYPQNAWLSARLKALRYPLLSRQQCLIVHFQNEDLGIIVRRNDVALARHPWMCQPAAGDPCRVV